MSAERFLLSSLDVCILAQMMVVFAVAESEKTVVRKWQMEVPSSGSCVLPGCTDKPMYTSPPEKHVACVKPERAAQLITVASEANGDHLVISERHETL